MIFQELRETCFTDIAKLTERQLVRLAANRVLRQINDKFPGIMITETALTKQTDTATLSVQAYADGDYIKTATNQNWVTLGFTLGEVIFLTSFTKNVSTHIIEGIIDDSSTNDKMELSGALQDEGASDTVVEHWEIASGYTLDYANRLLTFPPDMKKLLDLWHNDDELDPVDHEVVHNTSSDALDVYAWLGRDQIRFATDILGSGDDVLKATYYRRISQLPVFDVLADDTDLGITQDMEEVLLSGTKAFILAIPKYFDETMLNVEREIYATALDDLIEGEVDKREPANRAKKYNYTGEYSYPDN